MHAFTNAIHIITLNVPDPPDYGGMIDTYNRILALHEIGIKIHLHCFAYGRKPSEKLESVCETVHYYPRHSSFITQLSFKPYIVASRKSNLLLERLLQIEAPIFFDGLHTTYYLNHPLLQNRIKVVRVHNVEHTYYGTLATFENNIFRKIFYFTESLRLKRFEKILFHAKHNITVSPTEQSYFSEKYKNAVFIPPFHPFSKIESLPGEGKYVLFHADLSVIENVKTCSWLIQNIFSKTKHKCVIAGKNPPVHLLALARTHANVSIFPDPSTSEMNNFIKEAHIIILLALKTNGFKLKLLVSLYSGRFCLANPVMVENTSLDSLCHIANTDSEFINTINTLMTQPFTLEMIARRQTLLDLHFNIRSNALKIMETLT